MLQKTEEFEHVAGVVKRLLNVHDHEVVLDAAWGLSSLAGWGIHAIDSLIEAGILDHLMMLLEE